MHWHTGSASAERVGQGEGVGSFAGCCAAHLVAARLGCKLSIVGTWWTNSHPGCLKSLREIYVHLVGAHFWQGRPLWHWAPGCQPTMQTIACLLIPFAINELDLWWHRTSHWLNLYLLKWECGIFLKPLLTWVMTKSVLLTNVSHNLKLLCLVQRLRYVHHSQATPSATQFWMESIDPAQLHELQATLTVWWSPHLATALLHCSTFHASTALFMATALL